ncbi:MULTISPECIES: LysR substrate-binding domain-containing protein [unclassified Rhizobium]|uniref:LysR substrate-binding domain-containing protein n=1 Tax=unclassified Rhizobium TaxID=2613769 RepID=UPI001782824F|nr:MULTISPECIES: LysR substrate-binding domain-containing protein [unclassified Rhizobium]MBD8687308.1 LysR family transcriptional regulator [Rhizobium sp. CFBP 13644]MBD8691762.1 LysR family transcriptional regulator [Rhizobium sp. CFBP 13717]
MKRSELPSLDDLRAFQTVARLGSVRAAAAELVLTHGAISRRVSKLSADLGLQLLEADGRGVRLTPVGARLADATGRAFATITDTLAEIRSSSAPGPIILSCERSLAMRWLIPRLSGFQDRHPDVEVHLSTGGGGIDFARDRVTLAIRRLDFLIDPDWTIIKLMPERVGPVMVPSLRKGFDAGNYVALGSRTRPHAWESWFGQHPETPRPRASQLLDHHFLMAEAALGGLGVALAPQAIAADDVTNGRLEAPLGFAPDGTHYGLIHPKSMFLSTGVQALMDWLTKESETCGSQDR